MPGGLGFIGWIIIGGLAGWIASKIMGTDEQQGILLNIVVGIVGAFLGGLILGLVMDTDGMGWILTFLTAIAGACLLLWIVGMVRGGRSRV
jgi:uncharacterized membrane protein YeaQ/YmgE (transglycosylase-associated protein family)